MFEPFSAEQSKSAVAIEKTSVQVHAHSVTMVCFSLGLLFCGQMCVSVHFSRPPGPKTHLYIIRARCKVKPQQMRGKSRFVIRSFFFLIKSMFFHVCTMSVLL